MRRRSNPWPALVDLFSALLLPVFGGLIIISANLPGIRDRAAKAEKGKESSQQVIQAVQQKIGTTASTPEEITIALDEYTKMVAASARRGKRKCQDVNTLVYISHQNGKLKLHLQPGVEKLAEEPPLSGKSRFVAGQILTGPDQIDRFLSAVGQYYASHADCRYDYRLTYKTDTDYRIARSRFERYFYPENISPSSARR